MKQTTNDRYMPWVILVLGFVFLRSGYGKLVGGEFVGGLGKTLGFFASENPFPFVKSFLETVAIPNATLFGLLTMWGEVFAGVVLVGTALYLIMRRSLPPLLGLLLIPGLLIAVFLNFTFLLSAGWTSASTESVNLVMTLIGIISLVYAMRTFRTSKRK